MGVWSDSDNAGIVVQSNNHPERVRSVKPFSLTDRDALPLGWHNKECLQLDRE